MAVDISGLNLNGSMICNTYIHEEILANILTYFDSTTLIRSRKVCKFWKSLIDSKVWHLKVVSEYCRNLPDTIRINSSNISWLDLYGICKKVPLGRNLVRNNCGQDKLKKWKILSSGGNRWTVEKTPAGADPLPISPHFRHTSCFATSYHSCSKIQTIDLSSEGLTSSFLDKIQPKIQVSDWFAARFDCGSIYELKAKLLAENKDIIKEFSFRETVDQWQGGSWKQVSHEFKEYGPGVRYVEFYHAGMDTQFWAGHYGSKMSGACVVVDL